MVNRNKITFKIDTGADVTIITENTARQLQIKLEKPRFQIVGADGTALRVVGESEVVIRKGNLQIKAFVTVLEGARNNLLGKPEILRLQILKGMVLGIQEQHPTLFGGLGQLPDEFNINLKEGAVPYAISVPRKLPIGLRDETEKELKRMLELGVIERVEEYREWCAGMVVAPKSSGAVRICVDLTQLNKSVKRENFPLPRVEEMLAMIDGSQVFSKMDANSGFWQIKLNEESRKLTTFITPFGRFQFKKMPFGISAAPEFFQRQMNKVLAGLKGVLCMMDDILVYGADREQHDMRLKAALERLEQVGMTLNNEKCEFGVSRVKFLGHVISREGIEADPDKVKAIIEMKPPQCKRELKGFLGMVNYLSKFNPYLAELEKPLRDLIKKDSTWVWDCDQQDSFEKVKQAMARAPVLAKFSLGLKHRVSADASAHALGAALLQETGRGEWQPVAFASRSMTGAERVYAQLEKEALAITWACEKFDFYLVGSEFEVETDHKPLVKLLGSSDLSEMPLRCQRFKLRLMRYNFKIFHTPGTKMYLADLLSRPAGGVSIKEKERGNRVDMHVDRIMVAKLEATDLLWKEVAERGQEDQNYKEVIKQIKNSWPEKAKSYRGRLKEYYNVRERLSTREDLVMYDERIVIPDNMCEEIVQRLHVGHQGIERTMRRAKDSVWWPRLRRDVEHYAKNCRECIKNSLMKRQPLRVTPLPSGPWKRVATDLFNFRGRDYVLVIDFYSRWIEVMELRDQTTESVIKRLQNIFARWGFPVELVSDNGPCYGSEEFKEWLQRKGTRHITSSPRYPQSNGMAERAVRTVKESWTKENDKNMALLIYRNTPLESGSSPAQLLIGRSLRTNLPRVEKSGDSDFEERDIRLKSRMKRNYDRGHKVKELPELKEGDRVWIKTSGDDPGIEGKILLKCRDRDSYWVETDRRTVRRTRIHLRKLSGTEITHKEGSLNGMSQGVNLPKEDYVTEGNTEESDGSDEVEGSGDEDSSVGEDSQESDDRASEERGRTPQRQHTRSGRTVKRGHLRDDYEYDWC